MNEGRRKLLEVLQTRTQQEVARAVGCSQQAIADLARGRGFAPRLRLALDLRDAFGIAPDAWFVDD